MATEQPVVLIIGAGDYIGAAICKKFAAGGYQVCMGRRNEDKLLPLKADIESAGGIAHAYALDARNEDRVIEVFEEIEQNIGPLEMVIYNPGGNVNFPIRDTTSRVFQKVWEMACFGGFLCGREAAKYMAPRRKGSIFFTGATASIRGGSGYAAFASAKFGLRALAQSMARELGPESIHVAHVIIDAGVETEWVRERLRENGVDPEQLPEATLMNPQSVADTYWYLHHQAKDAWTHELDIRPFAETF